MAFRIGQNPKNTVGASLVIGTTAGTVAAGDDARIVGAASGVLPNGLLAEYAVREGGGTRLNNSGRPAVLSPSNLLTAPEGSFTSGWGGGGGACTDRYGLDPFGGDMATRLLSASGTPYVGQSPVLVSGVAYVASIYVASNTGATQTVRMFAGGAWGADITVPATGWKRVSATFTASGGASLFAFGPGSAGPATDVLIYGAKLEPGTTPSAYTPARESLALQFTGSPSWAGEVLDVSAANTYGTTVTPTIRLTQASVYVVAKWPTANAPSNGSYAGLLGADFSGGFMLAAANLGGTGGVGAPAFAFGGQGARQDACNLRDGLWHVVAGTYDGATVRLYIDDVEFASVSASNAVATATLVQMGSLNLGLPFPGQIAYGAIYTVGHTAAQYETNRRRIAAQMAAKGVTVGVLPKMIAYEGDSITAVGSEGNTYPLLIPRTQMGGTVTQGRLWAVSGSTLTHMNARAASVDAMAPANRTRGVLTVLIGRNDLNGQTSSYATGTFVPALKSYCLARRAAGWKIVLCTILPATVAGFNTARNAANTAIKADPSFYDALADLAADATMGPDAAASNTTYYPDGTHPNTAGEALLAPIVWAAMQAVL